MPDAFPKTYIDQIFYIWYNNDRPTAPKLRNMIPPEYSRREGETRRPNTEMLKKLIVMEFVDKAALLDNQIKEQLDKLVINEKIEMLKRHALVAKEMQSMALKYLEMNKEELTAPAAIRMLIEGIRIEKESIGLPEALEKMSKLTDDELLDEVQKLLTNGSQLIEIE